MLKEAEQPTGWNRHEGILEVLSMGSAGSNKRYVKVQWIAQYLPLLTCEDLNQDEWEIFQKGINSKCGKISVASPIPIEKIENFHNVYMKVLS